jgi:hypothetical protein
MGRVIIHVGYPKTASTFIQKQVLPKLKNSSILSHKQVYETGLINLKWKAERSIDYTSIKDRVKSHGDAFISFEGFTGIPLQGFLLIDILPQRLRKAIDGDIDILIFIRRQDQLIKSLYKQYIKQGGTFSYSNFISSSQFGGVTRFDLNAFDYLQTVKSYEEVFGKGRVHIFAYEWLQDDQNTFSKRFCDLVGEEVNIDFHIRRNVGLSGRKLKLCRFLNRFFPSTISEKGILPTSFIERQKIVSAVKKQRLISGGKTFTNAEEALSEDCLNKLKSRNQQLDDYMHGLDLKKLGYY